MWVRPIRLWCRGPGLHPACLMPRASQICSAPSCSSLMPCDAHPTGPWANSTRRTQLPRNWPKIRRRILKRDPLCTLGYEGCTGFSTEVHHTGDPMDHSDQALAGTCSSCHSRDTAAQSRQAKADQALGLRSTA